MILWARNCNNDYKQKNRSIATSVYCARDGNRTRTGITANRILSPARLPIPPPGRVDFFNKKRI